MKNQPYHFEIKDLVTQFISALNDVIINRYNKDRSITDKLRVRFLYAPKQRVLHDIINKNQHITLPVIAVSISTVSRDETRVFNKIMGFYDDKGTVSEKSTFVPSPIPVNIGVSMSILTKYQTDMDQILSNFIPYANPYIVISWKLPNEFSAGTREIRSEVDWDGTVNVTYPVDQQPGESARVTADTNFTIKGWLFPAKTSHGAKNIFYINTNFTALTGFDYV